MLIESKVESEIVLIEAEAASGIDKSSTAGSFDPDNVLQNVVGLVGAFTRALSESANQGAMALPTPARMEIRFGVRVDSNSVVSIGKTPEGCQFQVMVAWNP